MELLFLEDIGAEVEIDPEDRSDVEDRYEVKKKPKRRKIHLTMAEKKQLLSALQTHITSNSSAVVTSIITAVDKENHIHIFKNREKFWSSLQEQEPLLLAIINGLTDLFVQVYKSCQKGKEKYSKFQVEWHQCCSKLLDEIYECDKCLSEVHEQWHSYCNRSNISKEVRNPVIISLCAAVYDYLASKVIEMHSPNPLQSASIQEDDDDVYYRFGGASLAAMLKLRYNKLKSVSESSKITIQAQIKVLQTIVCTNKSDIPEYLQYRDKGHMYFPKQSFISFIKSVDKCILQHANETSFQQHGTNLVAMYQPCSHSYRECTEK